MRAIGDETPLGYPLTHKVGLDTRAPMSNKPKAKARTKAGAKPIVADQAPSDPKWRKAIAPLVVVSIVASIIALVVLSPPEARGIPEGTQTLPVGDPRHVDGVLYAVDELPVGGQHAGIWLNCGFYDQPVAAENIVHSMEHGAVWVAYDPGLSSQDIQSLRGFVSPSEKVIVSPVAGMDFPVVASAWGTQLELDDPTDPRIAQFVNEFTRGLTAPEPGGACTGGVGQPQF